MSVVIDKDICINCNLCVFACPTTALAVAGPDEISVNEILCEQEEGCKECIDECTLEAISIRDEDDL